MPIDDPKKFSATAPTQPAMAAQPHTRAQPAMTDRAMLEDLYRLNKAQTETLGKQTTALTSLAADVGVLGGQQTTILSRVNGLEFRMSGVEDRMNSNSVRAKQPSEHDLKAQAELANEITAREALAVEVAAIKRETSAQSKALVGIATDSAKAVQGFVNEHPLLFRSLVGIATTLATAAAAWLSAKGH